MLRKKGLTLVQLIGAIALVVVIAVVIVLCVAGCDSKAPDSADRRAQEKTESTMKEASSQVGFPAIVNFQELKIAKMIYELRDQEKLICHAYLYNRNNGTIGQYLGKCIGFGLPYSVQFSNPEKIIRNKDALVNLKGVRDDNYAGSSVSMMAQPEPNGLFMPQGLSATWLILINPVDGEPYPVYIEPEIIVSPFPLHKTG